WPTPSSTRVVRTRSCWPTAVARGRKSGGVSRSMPSWASREGAAVNREAHEADGRPWGRPGAVQRDCEPHRGAVLLALGRVRVLGFLSLAGGVAAPAALAVGVVALVLCARDEREMAAGRRDPAGEEPLVSVPRMIHDGPTFHN